MRIIIGGAYQGKLRYALNIPDITEEDVFYGKKDAPETIFEYRVINQTHELIRRLMLDGSDPTSFLMKVAEKNPDVIILCDEVGLGIVPLDPTDRAYREQVGRTMCVLTKYAGRVDRVIAGIEVRIK